MCSSSDSPENSQNLAAVIFSCGQTLEGLVDLEAVWEGVLEGVFPMKEYCIGMDSEDFSSSI